MQTEKVKYNFVFNTHNLKYRTIAMADKYQQIFRMLM